MTELNESEMKKGLGARAAAVASMILWILGFALAFVVPTGSPWSWVPDALLLLGFFPLLYAWRPGWPWLIFGLLNAAIGFFLLVIFYLPAADFPADVIAKHPEIIAVRDHLAQKHSPWTWMLLGVFSTVFGLFRMIRSLVRLIAKRVKKVKSSSV